MLKARYHGPLNLVHREYDIRFKDVNTLEALVDGKWITFEESYWHVSHYDWLLANLNTFINKIKPGDYDYRGMVVGHGDKCYGYKDIWKSAGILFHHGVALYMLTYINPWSKTVRDVDGEWVAPDKWVIDQYPKYKEFLPD